MSTCTPWVTPNELTDCDCPDASEPLILEAIQIASNVLYALSGRRYPGVCSESVRPCLCASCALPYPVLVDGSWVNITCGHDTYCGCGGRALRLPRDRVTDVTSVTLDGTMFADFRLDRPNVLVRTDGSVWPSRQDIWKEPTEAGTWMVDYSFGREPPAGGKFAAKWLTSEILKACTGGKCRLPAHAVAVSQRGISYNLEAVDGRVGIPEADMWLNAVNPHKRTRPARVTSADDVSFVPVDSGS